MIKEPKNIDFTTSGRQLTDTEFTLISQWIASDKKKQVKGRAKPKISKQQAA